MATWPFSPFARPTGSFNLPVPPPVPAGGFCNQLTVTYPAEWQPYIISALAQLTLQATWQGDESTIQAAQEIAWSIIRDIQMATCVQPQIASGIECDGGDCMCCCQRFEGGKLQTLVCGVWTDVPGQQSGPGGQPGGGSPQPQPGGGEATYCFKLPGNGVAVLPTGVTSGDTILIQDPAGAYADGETGNVSWRCPNGYVFFLGQCIWNNDLDALNPMPTITDMQLICKIGSTFYDVYNRDVNGNPQLFTVPPGIVNEQLIFLPNDNAPGSNAGDITFCALVTNNQTPTWSHTFDFTTSNGGFDESEPNGQGTWVSGIGWQGSDHVNTDGNAVRGIQIERFCSHPETITKLQIIFDYTEGTFTNPSDFANFAIAWQGGGHIFEYTVAASAMVNGSNQVQAGAVSAPLTTKIELILAACVNHDGVTFDGSCTIRQCTVSGTGIDPF